MAGNEDMIICRCEEVTQAEILEAIRDGATTVSGVKRRTRAGMGLCQGRTCRKVVAKMVVTETGQSAEEVLPSTYRPPVRPVTLGTLANEWDE